MSLSFLVLNRSSAIEPRVCHSPDSFVLVAEGHKGLISHLNVDMTTPCPQGRRSVLGGHLTNGRCCQYTDAGLFSIRQQSELII